MPKRVYTHAYATLRFMSQDGDPREVTRSLLLPPDSIHYQGDPRIRRRLKGGEVHVYAEYGQSMWSMSSKKWVESPVLNTHLLWLLDQLEPLQETIVDLLKQGWEADFFCFSNGDTSELPSFPKTTTDRADALGISIDIDHYEQNRND